MPKYLEFEVSLQEVNPKIWRRFQLRDRATFLQLHEAIQDSAGWWNYHLFLFRNPNLDRGEDMIAGISSDEDEDTYGGPLPDARLVKLVSYFNASNRSCEYEYDFGDGWICDVKLVQEITEVDIFKRKLLGGERAFPHEDSGGISGYERFSEIAKKKRDPYGEDVKELLKWLGGWHPEKFDYSTTKQYFDKNKHVPVPGYD